MALKKSHLAKWLMDYGFIELPGKATSFRQFKHDPSGVKVTIAMHGRRELSKKHLGMVLRQLESAGFNKEEVRKDLGE